MSNILLFCQCSSIVLKKTQCDYEYGCSSNFFTGDKKVHNLLKFREFFINADNNNNFELFTEIIKYIDTFDAGFNDANIYEKCISFIIDNISKNFTIRKEYYMHYPERIIHNDKFKDNDIKSISYVDIDYICYIISKFYELLKKNKVDANNILPFEDINGVETYLTELSSNDKRTELDNAYLFIYTLLTIGGADGESLMNESTYYITRKELIDNYNMYLRSKYSRHQYFNIDNVPDTVKFDAIFTIRCIISDDTMHDSYRKSMKLLAKNGIFVDVNMKIEGKHNIFESKNMITYDNILDYYKNELNFYVLPSKIQSGENIENVLLTVHKNSHVLNGGFYKKNKNNTHIKNRHIKNRNNTHKRNIKNKQKSIKKY